MRLTQVVSNLLTNAARYTRPGGRIDVTAARDGGEVRLNVIDNGVGIDPALLPHLFEMFVQGPRGFDRAEGGLGLGLSLVRTLTELHGGSVTAQSDGEGRGSMFTVRLPLSEAIRLRRNARAPARGRAPPQSARKVLIVDDNRDAAVMVSILLTRAGHQVEIAADAAQALAAVAAFRPRRRDPRHRIAGDGRLRAGARAAGPAGRGDADPGRAERLRTGAGPAPEPRGGLRLAIS